MLPRTVRSSLALVLLVMALLAAATPATSAEPWPSAPIRMIVPFAPGGSNDVIARYMSQYLAKSLGQSVVVENRAGGGSTIGAQALAASPPDGYTYMFVSGSLATSAAVQKTPYDPIKAFDAVSQVAVAPFVIITREGFPAKNVLEFVAYAKANPKKINYGTAGLGNSTELITELFSTIAGIRMTAIGYKGIAPAQMDLVAGRLDIVITTMASTRGTTADKLPKIAFTSAKRDPEFPNVPTVREAGIDYVVDVWWGVFAPAGTPPAIRDRMNKEIAGVVAIPEFAAFVKLNGAMPVSSTPQALHDLYVQDIVRWTETAKRAGIQQQ